MSMSDNSGAKKKPAIPVTRPKDVTAMHELEDESLAGEAAKSAETAASLPVESSSADGTQKENSPPPPIKRDPVMDLFDTLQATAKKPENDETEISGEIDENVPWYSQARFRVVAMISISICLVGYASFKIVYEPLTTSFDKVAIKDRKTTRSKKTVSNVSNDDDSTKTKLSIIKEPKIEFSRPKMPSRPTTRATREPVERYNEPKRPTPKARGLTPPSRDSFSDHRDDPSNLPSDRPYDGDYQDPGDRRGENTNRSRGDGRSDREGDERRDDSFFPNESPGDDAPLPEDDWNEPPEDDRGAPQDDYYDSDY